MNIFFSRLFGLWESFYLIEDLYRQDFVVDETPVLCRNENRDLTHITT